MDGETLSSTFAAVVASYQSALDDHAAARWRVDAAAKALRSVVTLARMDGVDLPDLELPAVPRCYTKPRATWHPIPSTTHLPTDDPQEGP